MSIIRTETEHDAVGGALAAYEHALDTYDRLLARDDVTDRELQDAQDDIDNIHELCVAAREAAGHATEKLRVEPVAPSAKTAWLRDVKLDW